MTAATMHYYRLLCNLCIDTWFIYLMMPLHLCSRWTDVQYLYGVQTVNLALILHKEQKWPHLLHSSKLEALAVIRTHQYTCAFLILKMYLLGWIAVQWQRRYWILTLHIVKLFIFCWRDRNLLYNGSTCCLIHSAIEYNLLYGPLHENWLRQRGQISP